MADRELQVIVKAEVEKAIANLKRVDDQTDNTAGKMGGLGKVAGFVGKGMLAVGAALLGVATASIKSAADFEKQKVAFEVLLGSAGKAQTLLKQIEQFAATTPFQMPGLIEGSKRLMAFGTSAKDVVQKMRNLGNAAMGDQAVLDRLVNAYGKLQAKGKASLEEINMFTEAGVPILQTLQEQYGVTQDEMFKMISTGKVGFEDVDKALTTLTTNGGKFAGMIEKQSMTMSGLFSTVQDNIGLIAKDIGDTLAPQIKESLVGAIQFLQDNKENIVRGFASTFQTISNIVSNAFEFIKQIGSSFAEIFQIDTNTESALNSLDQVLSGISSSLSVLFEIGKKVFESVFKAAKPIVDEIFKAVEDLFGEVDGGNVIFNILGGIVQNVSAIFAILAKVVKLGVVQIVDLVKIVTTSADVLGKFFELMADPFSGAKQDAFAKSLETSKAAIDGFVSHTIENTGELIQETAKQFQNFQSGAANTADELKKIYTDSYESQLKAKQEFVAKNKELQEELDDDNAGGGASPQAGMTAEQIEAAKKRNALMLQLYGTDEENFIASMNDRIKEYKGILGEEFDEAKYRADQKAEYETTKIKETIDIIQNEYNKYAGFASSVLDSIKSAVDMNYNNEIQKIENKYDKQIAIAQATIKNEDELAEKLTQIEQDKADEIAAIKKQQWEANKTAAIISSIINTASAVVSTFAQFGFPWGLIPAGIMAGLGAAQTAVIASQPTPAFAQGGDFMTSKPTTIRVGDNPGGMEKVSITPISRSDSDSGNVIITQPLILQVDTDVIWRGLLKASRDGIALIDNGAVV